MSRRPRTPRNRVARLVSVVVAAAFVLTGCEFSIYKLPLPGGADLGDDPYSVTVEFRDVLDLVPHSAVKVNDVSVGRVDEINLDGYTAEAVLLVNDDIELPDNALAKIRQTSLLGEKFVSLEPPAQGASGSSLEDGDVIPLERTGRNAEVEEVLGAMSLLLNGGGVGQLNTIAVELNKALGGREPDVKSVLNQLDLFMGQLDEGKGDIIDAIESLNQLSISLNEEEESIKLALDEMPAALASIDRQRDDLVRMLDALDELSNVAVGVIRASKQGTIDSLEHLDPILTKLADAGQAFPDSLQVFLTYPFVDAVVGTNPTQARNLHMGDYTNLSVQIDLDLSGLTSGELPIDVCEVTQAELEVVRDDLRKELLRQLPDEFGPVKRQIRRLINQLITVSRDGCDLVVDTIQDLAEITECGRIAGRLDDLRDDLRDEADLLPTEAPSFRDLCDNGGAGTGDNGLDLRNPLGNNGPDIPNPLRPRERNSNNGGGGNGGGGNGGGGGGLDLPGLGRAAPGGDLSTANDGGGSEAEPTYDSDLGAMLIWGMVQR